MKCKMKICLKKNAILIWFYSSPNGDSSAYVPCKYICNFTDPRDSEPESDIETETEGENRNEEDISGGGVGVERVAATGEGDSWCSIL